MVKAGLGAHSVVKGVWLHTVWLRHVWLLQLLLPLVLLLLLLLLVLLSVDVEHRVYINRERQKRIKECIKILSGPISGRL